MGFDELDVGSFLVVVISICVLNTTKKRRTSQRKSLRFSCGLPRNLLTAGCGIDRENDIFADFLSRYQSVWEVDGGVGGGIDGTGIRGGMDGCCVDGSINGGIDGSCVDSGINGGIDGSCIVSGINGSIDDRCVVSNGGGIDGSCVDGGSSGIDGSCVDGGGGRRNGSRSDSFDLSMVLSTGEETNLFQPRFDCGVGFEYLAVTCISESFCCFVLSIDRFAKGLSKLSKLIRSWDG